MTFQSFDITKLNIYQPIVKDYLTNKLDKYTSAAISKTNLINASNHRIFSNENRQVLVKVLQKQYEKLSPQSKCSENISSLLNENTFTVCTGHQLGLFTGPLYTIYKVLQTIALAESLNQTDTTKKYIPVFWLASEDHDLQEINHVSLFNKTYTWETNQTGAVGRMNTELISQLIDQIKQLFNNSEKAKQLIAIFEKAYSINNLAEATQYIFHELLGYTGLIVLNPDNKELKKLFEEYIVKDIVHESNIKPLASQTEELKQTYKTQVFPRNINFFHLANGERTRIKSKEEGGHHFNEDYIREHIEEFSPNVCLRPLFQEVILPNIAYIGGPGEISYWLQLKTMFDANNIAFPIIIPRVSVFVLNSNFVKKWKQLGFEIEEIFKSLDELKNIYVKNNAVIENIEAEQNSILAIKEQLNRKIAEIDITLLASVDLCISKTIEQLKNIDKKLEKTQKQKFENELNKIEKLYQEIFPNGTPQDRNFNLLQYADNINFDQILNYLKNNESYCIVISE